MRERSPPRPPDQRNSKPPPRLQAMDLKRRRVDMADTDTGAEARAEAVPGDSRGLPEAVVRHRRALIEQRGLPVELRVRRDGRWAAIDVWPLRGFVHCCTLEQYLWHINNGWPYHISLGWDVDPELVEGLAARLDGVRTNIAVEYFSRNGVAVLANSGLGADSELWAAYVQGHPGRVWALHISM